MHYVRVINLLLLPVLLLAAGCGSSTSGGATTKDPFSSSSPSTTSSNSSTGAPGTTTTTPQDPAFNLTLTTDLKAPTDGTSTLPRVDANTGTVVLTAKLLNMSGGVFVDPVSHVPVDPGAPVPNQTITYTVLAGPGSIAYTTPVTDKNGESDAIMTIGNALSTTNVIVEASVTVDNKLYRAYTQFQVVRGTGVITFITTKAATDPDGTLNVLDKEVDLPGTYYYMQELPIKVTDGNNNPRVGTKVTLSVDSQLTGLAKIDISNPVVTTDDAGKAIFNVQVSLTDPVAGVKVGDSIIYRAVSNDTVPLTAFSGFLCYITTKKPALVIAPTDISFTLLDGKGDSRNFKVTGGVPPFSANSSNPSRVSVAFADDNTLVATLVDTTPTTEVIKISVLDQAGQSATATINLPAPK